ncbi:hypothetical protein LINPERHAP1_LOCUS17370, partial [Linum perenne]
MTSEETRSYEKKHEPIQKSQQRVALFFDEKKVQKKKQ